MDNHKFWDGFVIFTTIVGLSLFSAMCIVTMLASASQELQGL